MFLAGNECPFLLALMQVPHIGLDTTQHLQHQIVDFGVWGVIFDEAIYQFRQVEATGHMPQIIAQVQEIFAYLGLGDNIEVASKSNL